MSGGRTLSRAAALRRVLSLLACLCFWAGAAAAESIMEMSHPGESLLPLDAHTLALGGAAEARWDLLSGLPISPAQLLALDGVTFSTVLQMRRALRDLETGNWDETRQDFPAFQVSASLPGGLRLGAGYRADMRSRGSFTRAVTTDEVAYDLHFEQSGGLNRFPLSLALPLGTWLRLGVGLNLFRGNLKQEWLFDFEHDLEAYYPDLDYHDRKVQRQASWHGTGVVLGLQAQPLAMLAASLRWEGPADLSGEETIEIAGDEAIETRSLGGRMPARWGAGLAFELPYGAVASMQWDHENWSSYESPLNDDKLQDVDCFSLGLEWARERELRDRRAGRQLPLRLGLRLDEQPMPDPLTGRRVAERLISLGTGIEVQAGRGSVDLTIFRQSLSVEGGEGETRWGLALGLRTSEIWQKRTVQY